MARTGFMHSCRLGMLPACAGLLLAMPLARAAKQGFNAPPDVQAITAIENALATDTHMADLIGYYAPDAIVFDIMAPGIYRGRAQIQTAFEQQFVPVASMKTDVQDMNIASDGRFACAALRLRFNMAMKNGTTVIVSTRQLDAFKKIAGTWQIVQEQVSVPADPKTGMAVMNATLPVRGAIAWPANPIPGPATSPAQARTEIRAWLDTGVHSANIDQLVSYYGPGDNVLIYDSFTPGELRGLQDIRTTYTPVMGSFNAIDVKIPLFIADSDGKFGIQIDTQDMKITLKNSTTKYVSLRQNDCMRRVGGAWKSFFEMISFPVDPKTGKAIAENPAAFQ